MARYRFTDIGANGGGTMTPIRPAPPRRPVEYHHHTHVWIHDERRRLLEDEPASLSGRRPSHEVPPSPPRRYGSDKPHELGKGSCMLLMPVDAPGAPSWAVLHSA
jgi:hypothetical protein